jgi:hypothetical protein
MLEHFLSSPPEQELVHDFQTVSHHQQLSSTRLLPITYTMRNDTLLQLSIRQPTQRMKSSSRLECSYPLIILTLEKQVDLRPPRLMSFIFCANEGRRVLRGRGYFGNSVALEDWRKVNIRLDALVGFTDGVADEGTVYLGDVGHCCGGEVRLDVEQWGLFRRSRSETGSETPLHWLEHFLIIF